MDTVAMNATPVGCARPIQRLGEGHRAKDDQHGPQGSGEADTCRALARAAWIGEFGPLDAVILHEPNPEEEREMPIGK
jgi:hypothetical protein